MNRIEKVHMVVEGEAITEFARKMFNDGKITDIGKYYGKEKRLEKAYEILESLIPKPSKEQMDKILKGEAYLKGDTTTGIMMIEEIDWKYKYHVEKEAKKEIVNAFTETVTVMKDVIVEMTKPIMERAEKRRKQQKETEKDMREVTTSTTKGTVMIGDHQIKNKTIEEYLQSIRFLERASMLGMSRGDPTIGIKALQLRIKKHRAIFDEVKIPYYQDKENENNRESFEFADAIEKYIEDKFPEDSKMERVKRLTDSE